MRGIRRGKNVVKPVLADADHEALDRHGEHDALDDRLLLLALADFFADVLDLPRVLRLLNGRERAGDGIGLHDRERAALYLVELRRVGREVEFAVIADREIAVDLKFVDIGKLRLAVLRPDADLEKRPRSKRYRICRRLRTDRQRTIEVRTRLFVN